MLCSPPEINPATARLSQSVQTPSLFPHPQNHRDWVARNTRTLLPLKWLEPKPASKNRTHLPIVAIAHSMLFLLGPEGDKPLPVISQHRLFEIYPEQPSGLSYTQLQQRCRDRLLEEWRAVTPDPARYRYLPSLNPTPSWATTNSTQVGFTR